MCKVNTVELGELQPIQDYTYTITRDVGLLIMPMLLLWKGPLGNDPLKNRHHRPAIHLIDQQHFWCFARCWNCFDRLFYGIGNDHHIVSECMCVCVCVCGCVCE